MTGLQGVLKVGLRACAYWSQLHSLAVYAGVWRIQGVAAMEATFLLGQTCHNSHGKLHGALLGRVN